MEPIKSRKQMESQSQLLMSNYPRECRLTNFKCLNYVFSRRFIGFIHDSVVHVSITAINSQEEAAIKLNLQTIFPH